MHQGDEGQQQITVPPRVGSKGPIHHQLQGTKRVPDIVLGRNHNLHEAKVEIKHDKQMQHALTVQGWEGAKEATKRIEGPLPMINDEADRWHVIKRKRCGLGPPLHDITPKTKNLISLVVQGEHRLRTYRQSFSVLLQNG